MIQYLFIMIWCHLIDDYVLQGCLANLKQKAWWKDNCPQDLYKNDYIMGLTCHSIMWSISIMIPTLISGNFIWWVIPFNVAIHCFVDNLKANEKKINLIIDQSIHFIQVLLTFCICYIK